MHFPAAGPTRLSVKLLEPGLFVFRLGAIILTQLASKGLTFSISTPSPSETSSSKPSEPASEPEGNGLKQVRNDLRRSIMPIVVVVPFSLLALLLLIHYRQRLQMMVVRRFRSKDSTGSNPNTLHPFYTSFAEQKSSRRRKEVPVSGGSPEDRQRDLRPLSIATLPSYSQIDLRGS